MISRVAASACHLFEHRGSAAGYLIIFQRVKRKQATYDLWELNGNIEPTAANHKSEAK